MTEEELALRERIEQRQRELGGLEQSLQAANSELEALSAQKNQAGGAPPDIGRLRQRAVSAKHSCAYVVLGHGQSLTFRVHCPHQRGQMISDQNSGSPAAVEPDNPLDR